MIVPLWQLIERAWLDLGARMRLDLGSKIEAEKLLEHLQEGRCLLPVNGVSAEMDADGVITSRFRYFQQRTENSTSSSSTSLSSTRPESCTAKTADFSNAAKLVNAWQLHWVLIEETRVDPEVSCLFISKFSRE